MSPQKGFERLLDRSVCRMPLNPLCNLQTLRMGFPFGPTVQRRKRRDRAIIGGIRGEGTRWKREGKRAGPRERADPAERNLIPDADP